MKKLTCIAVASFLMGAAILPAAAKGPVVNHAISETEVLAAQALAEKVIDSAYGYQMGAVLFKPTLTEVPQTFRTTREGALSYFVGGNPAYPKDTGFALKGWTKCEIANAAVFIAGDSANTIGNVMFTGKDGKVTTVDKSWAFVKDDAGKLRIVVHHSSLPYTGN